MHGPDGGDGAMPSRSRIPGVSAHAAIMHNIDLLASHHEPLMSLNLYLAFVAACIVVTVVPGPNVTLIVATGLRHGSRAALLCLAGFQTALAFALVIVCVGLTSLMATMGYWFDVIRLAGAAYLIWLGITMIRSSGSALADAAPRPPRGGFFTQGLLVSLSNPKILLFFGAFIPQFIDLNSPYVSQVTLLGITFMVVAGITDGTYGLLAGRARNFFSARRSGMLTRVSGGFIIGGGVWLAMTRAR
jgi:threonine/homoserine/homoserine lactone efflux protein